MTAIQAILYKAKQLDAEQQLNLLEELVGLIRKRGNNIQQPKITSITGIGAEIWNTNIDDYVSKEREW